MTGWLACVYHRTGCRHIPGLLPAYAKVLEPQLTGAPVTQADRSTQPRLASLRVVLACPGQAIAIARYRLARHHQLVLHPNLVLDSHGWQVFNLPEAGVQIPLPRPLAAGDQQC